jgi:hypothetical protein
MEQDTGVASSLLAFNMAGAMAIKGEARREILPPALAPTVAERLGWLGGEEVSRRVCSKRPSAGRLLTDRQ